MLKKIKGQGSITKWLTSRLAAYNKRKFGKLIRTTGALKAIISNLDCQASIAMQVVSFSSSNDFNEQILSILSFVRYVGTPDSWVIYSDGTHSTEQLALVNSEFTFVKFRIINLNEVAINIQLKSELLPYKTALLDYASKQPLGKKLLMYLNHEILIPTLFIDSDVLFYSKSSAIDSLLREAVNGWFLPDSNWGCLDSRYIVNSLEQPYQINSGYILFNSNLSNVFNGLSFLESMNGQYEYFSEQTIMHILLRENYFFPLDPRIFILDNSDQFDISYLYKRENIAIRHYTGPVRHKMWQHNWKWHLSLS